VYQVEKVQDRHKSKRFGFTLTYHLPSISLDFLLTELHH